MQQANRVLAVVGAQYGSEGKGNIVSKIAHEFRVHVRTGGPNAGHSFKREGRTHVQQVIPVGWTNPNAILIIGRGMYVDLEQLEKELQDILFYDPTIIRRLKIDANAGILDRVFHDMEGGVDGEMHQRIGSTGEGVGSARIHRIHRDPETFRLAASVERGECRGSGWDFCDLVYHDTIGLMHDLRYGGILLEGTQGSALSMVHGPWPYVTSHDTNAAQLAADAGLPPHWVTDVLLVARTFPIRVAGNSGPMTNELTWEQVSRSAKMDVQERTTVTKKVRRIGAWDHDLFQAAVRLNDPTEVAINFLDYPFPETRGVDCWGDLSSAAKAFVRYIETSFQVRVSMAGTGGPDWAVAMRGRT